MTLHEAIAVLSRYGLEVAPPHRRGTSKAQEIAAIIGGTTTRKKRKPITDEAVTLAIRMRNAGKTWKEVEAATGNASSALRRHMDF